MDELEEFEKIPASGRKMKKFFLKAPITILQRTPRKLNLERFELPAFFHLGDPLLVLLELHTDLGELFAFPFSLREVGEG